jgi:phage shock protein A
MENERDSSVWRSLAVAFGDGLAFGVGMKLTQNVARQPGTPQSGAAPLADRFERLEQRIERLEHTPIAALEAAPGPEPVGFARKVIETVVQAVDERLNEQSKQMERRLAELEAQIAETRSQLVAEIVAVHNRVEGAMHGFADTDRRLREELQRVADRPPSFDAAAAEAAIEMNLAPLRAEITETRRRLAEGDRAVAGMVAVHNRVEGAMQGLAESDRQLREEVQRVADRPPSFDAAAAEAAIEMNLAPLRAEIAETRRRLADNDHSTLDLILAIGQMCRQAAERIPVPAPLPPQSTTSLSNTEPPVNGSGDSADPAPEAPVVSLDPSLESPPPAFTQLKKATSLWRIPMVSSFLLATGGLLLLHYL